MSLQAYDALIAAMAKLLVGNQVDPSVIQGALEMICGSFSLDLGAVYQADHLDSLRLMERCSAGAPLPERFELSAMGPQYRAALAAQPVSYLTRESCHSPGQLALLDLFSANMLAVAPVSDEGLRIHGLLLCGFRDARAPLAEADGQALTPLLSMLTRYVDIRMYQNKLAWAQTSLESILDNTGIDIYVNDFYTHDILYVNKSMAAPYGGAGKFMGKKCWQTLFPGQAGPCEFCPQKQLIDEHGAPTKIYTWDYQRAFDGSWFRVFSAAFRWVDGRLAHVVSSADITDNKQNEALIAYMANYDELTRLPNRRMLVSECERRIDRAGMIERGYLLFFDIDHFKQINDTLGHDAGDEFLVQLGQFFSSHPLLKNNIYRNGGDEFVAIIGGEGITKAHIQSLSDHIHARFEQPWVLAAGSVFCNISIGAACYPEDGRTAEELLRKSDMAMYRVKKSGGAGLCFGSQLSAPAE